MNIKYKCTYCVGCQAQENKDWKPKIECENFRDDGRNHFADVRKLVYVQQKIKD